MPDIDPLSVNLPVLSTAILPDALFVGSGHSNGMDLPAIYDNIQRLLKAKGRSADSVSKAAGTPDAIRNLKRTIDGKIKATPTVRTLTAVAVELGSTFEEITKPRVLPDIHSAPGVRDAILRKIEWLEREKAAALDELAALDQAEMAIRKPPRRKIR